MWPVLVAWEPMEVGWQLPSQGPPERLAWQQERPSYPRLELPLAFACSGPLEEPLQQMRPTQIVELDSGALVLPEYALGSTVAVLCFASAFTAAAADVADKFRTESRENSRDRQKALLEPRRRAPKARDAMMYLTE